MTNYYTDEDSQEKAFESSRVGGVLDDINVVDSEFRIIFLKLVDSLEPVISPEFFSTAKDAKPLESEFEFEDDSELVKKLRAVLVNKRYGLTELHRLRSYLQL